MNWGGFPALGNYHLSEQYSYRTIGPEGLERNLGNRVGNLPELGESRVIGYLAQNSEGDYAIMKGNFWRTIPHGDRVILRTNGKGFNSSRAYVFIDESD